MINVTEKTIRLTTAQALVKFLNNQYIDVDGEVTPFVEGIFSIFGHGNVLGLGQALEQDPGHLHVFQGKNEQGMGHAAVAFSRENLRRKIYGITASAGPGSNNMLTAAATAMANHIPLLVLPADTFATRQPDPVLQQIEHEHNYALTSNDAFQSVSRYWDRIQRPEQLMSSLLRAFEVMTNPATAGPATIAVCQDTEGEAYDYPEDFFKKRIHVLERPRPSDRAIQEAVEAIQAAKKPVILVGGGARYSEAGEILKEISTKHNIPLVETHAGKSTVEYTFENNLGGHGILGTSAANEVAMNADLIIGVGTRYTDFTTSSKTHFKPDAKFVNINVNRMQVYKYDGVQVLGDAKVALEMIADKLGNYETQYGAQLKELKNEWDAERQRLAEVTFDRENFKPEIEGHFSQEKMNEYADTLETELSQTAAFIAVNDFVDGHDVVIGAAGSLPGDMQRLWNTTQPNTYHLEYGYSTMGYEVNGALGVKLAKPDSEVYALVGDASFIMGHSELVTSLQENKKINVIVFDNSGFGSINNLQMDHGSGSYHCEFTTYDDKVMKIDYAKVAEGYGAKTYSVHNLDELKAALEDAKKQTVSTLIDIKVLPKTMTDGYGGWWRVGVNEVSQSDSVREAYEDQQKMIRKARKY